MADPNGTPDRTGLSRRRLLTFGLGLVATVAAPGIARASNRVVPAPPRVLNVVNTNTGESLRDVEYWSGGNYVPDAIAALDRLLRDHRSGEIHPIDPHLFDRLREIQQKIGYKGEIHLVSGYRTPETNDMLLEAAPANVAVNSFHTRGQALDMRVPGMSIRNVQRAAMTGQIGGVGYYPRANFIHLDVGPVRTWSDAKAPVVSRRPRPVNVAAEATTPGKPKPPPKPAQKAVARKPEPKPEPRPVRPPNR